MRYSPAVHAPVCSASSASGVPQKTVRRFLSKHADRTETIADRTSREAGILPDARESLVLRGCNDLSIRPLEGLSTPPTESAVFSLPEAVAARPREAAEYTGDRARERHSNRVGAAICPESRIPEITHRAVFRRVLSAGGHQTGFGSGSGPPRFRVAERPVEPVRLVRHPVQRCADAA